MRKLLVFLLIFAFVTPSHADFGAHSSAICGAMVRSEADLRKTIAKDYGDHGIDVEYHNLAGVADFAKYLDELDPKETREARARLAAFMEHADTPGYRTAAITLSGESAGDFLASAKIEAKELGEIARKHRAIHPFVIGFFGIRAVAGGFAAYKLIENDKPIALAILAAVAGMWKGSAVVKYLMRARKSPLESFIRRETALVAAKSLKMNLLSVTGYKVLDYKLAKFVDGKGINPYSAEIVYETLPYGAPNVSRIFKGKNPRIRRRESRLELIAMPNAEDPSKRTLLVLLSEEI